MRTEFDHIDNDRKFVVADNKEYGVHLFSTWGSGATIRFENVPALVLAILKAAGVNQAAVEDADLAGAYNSLTRYLKRREVDQAASILNKRRDELARELNGGGIDAAHDTYAGQPMPIRAAIDRIIALESAS